MNFDWLLKFSLIFPTVLRVFCTASKKYAKVVFEIEAHLYMFSTHNMLSFNSFVKLDNVA